MKIAIATAFYNSLTFSAYTSSLMATCKLLHTEGIEYDFWELPSDTYVHRGKNIISNYFLNSDCTDLFIIDSDMGWNPYDFLKIVKCEKEIVGANYPCKNDYEKWAGSAIDKTDANELIKANVLPGGFVRIKRCVFENIIREKPEFVVIGGNKTYDFWSHIHEGEHERGDDISFGLRCKAVGYDLYLMTNCNMVHFGFKGWSGNYNEYLTRQPKPEVKI